MKGRILLVLLTATISLAEESFTASSTKIAISAYGDCSSSEDFYVCLKKKALTLLDRLGRTGNISFSESVNVVRDVNATVQKEELTDSKLDEILPRSVDAKNAVLTEMLYKKIGDIVGSRTIRLSLPRTFPDEDEENLTEEGKLEIIFYECKHFLIFKKLSKCSKFLKRKNIL